MGARVATVVVALLAVGVLAESGPAKRATFPGPNGQLVYTLSQLYVVNPDGSGKREVTTSTPQRPIRAFQPGWAPDGFRITFANTVGTSTGGGIWIINSDGTGGARVPNTQQNDAWPTFSPDGRQIAFMRNENRYDRLFVVNVDGTGLRSVMPDAQVHVADPEWSPDGARFTFSNGGDVFVVNSDGTGLRTLTTAETGNARHPSWSPDGSQIAYATNNEVKVIPVDGGASRTVIGGLREAWEVSWSPDGTQIAYVHDEGRLFQEELYVINADGSNPRRLNVDTETTTDWGKLGAVPPPVVGVSVNLAPVSGTVRVRIRGTNRFVSLARLRNVPVGSELDVTRGRVRLVAAAGGRRTQSGIFFQGRGIVRQPRGRTPVTTLQVSGPLVCPRRSFGVEQRPPPRVRRLWGNATGRFRTQGRYATAAVRGTIWLTEDRCDGTFIRVRTGRVQIRDLPARRTITIRAGQTYLARARR